MTAGPFLTYDVGLKEMIDNDIDWAADAITAVLLGDGYTPDRAAHSTYDDIDGEEIADGDYAQVQIAGKAVAVNGTTTRVTHSAIDFGDPVTISAKYLAYVVGTAGALDTGGRVLGVVDLNDGGGELASSDGEFSFTPDASGLFYFSRSAAP